MSDAFEAADGRARRPPDGRARRGGGRGRRRPRPPVGGDGRRRRPTASRGGGRVDLRVEDHRDAAGRAAPAAARSSAPTSSRARATSCWPRAGRDEAGDALPARGRARARTPTSCCSGPAWRIAHAGDLDGGVAAVRRAAEQQPAGWSCSTGSRRSSPRRASASAELLESSRSPAGGSAAGGRAGVDVDAVGVAPAWRPARRRPAGAVASPIGEAVNEHLLTSLPNVDRVDVAGGDGSRTPGGRAAGAPACRSRRDRGERAVPSAASDGRSPSASRRAKSGRLLAVDAVGVQAGRDAGGVGGERRAGGVAGLDAAGLLADGLELERAAALEVVGADARLVARRWSGSRRWRRRRRRPSCWTGACRRCRCWR